MFWKPHCLPEASHLRSPGHGAQLSKDNTVDSVRGAAVGGGQGRGRGETESVEEAGGPDRLVGQRGDGGGMNAAELRQTWSLGCYLTCRAPSGLPRRGRILSLSGGVDAGPIPTVSETLQTL